MGPVGSLYRSRHVEVLEYDFALNNPMLEKQTERPGRDAVISSPPQPPYSLFERKLLPSGAIRY